MSAAAVRGVVRRLGPTPDPPPDAELVSAFAARRDPAAFAELVRRHGPTVLGACRRVLGDRHDAEDAFQAVFLVFSRKAGSIRPPGAVGGWLYGVAVRTANKARVAAARRRRREMIAAAQANPERQRGGGVENAELRSALDEELARLPEPLRAAVVLCDLHGRTRAEAAAELGCPEGTVAARLHRGRKKLADALTRRGLALPAAGIAAALEAAPVSASLAQSALTCATGGATAAVQALAREVIRGMTATAHLFAAGLLAVVAGGLLAATMAPVADAPGSGAVEPGASATGGAVAQTDPPREKPAPEPGAWREVKVLDQAGWLAGSVAYSPDGKALFVGGTEGHVRAYAAGEFKRQWDHKGEGKLSAVAVAPNGKRVAAGTRDGVQLLDADTGKAGDRLEEKGMDPLAVGFFEDTPLADGIPPVHHLALADARGCAVKSWRDGRDVSTIRISSVAAGAKPADEYAVPLAVAPNRRRVVVTGPVDRATGKNVLWAWAAGARVPNELLEGHKAVVVSAAWSNDGKLIVTGDADGVVITWDAATFKEKSRLKLGGRVAAVAVTAGGDDPDGEFGEPQGKVVRRRADVVEINLGSDAAVKPGLTFTVLPSDFPERGRQSRMRVMRVPDGAGGYKNVERFVEKAKIEVVEVLGPNLSRCKVTHEFDPIRDGAAVGDLLYKPVGRKGSHVAAAVVRTTARMDADRYDEEVFVWPAASPPAEPKPISRNAAGGPFAGVASVAFSPDGRSLAAAFCNFDRLARGGKVEHVGKVRVFAVADGKGKPEPPAPQPGKKQEGNRDVWEKRKDPQGFADWAHAVAFTPDGTKLLTANYEGGVTPFQIEAERLRSGFTSGITRTGTFHTLAFAPDGSTFAVTGKHEVRVCSLKARDTGPFGISAPLDTAVIESHAVKDADPTAIAFSPDGKRVAFSNGRKLWVRNVGKGGGFDVGPFPDVPADGTLPASVAFSPDGKRVLFLPNAKLDPAKPTHWCAQVWEYEAAKSAAVLVHGKGQVTCAAWSADGKRIVTGGTDGEVVVWDGETFKELKRLKLSGPVRAIAPHADGKRFAAGVLADAKPGEDSAIAVEVWAVRDGSTPDDWARSAALPLPSQEQVMSVALAPGGSMLAATVRVKGNPTRSYGLRVWDRAEAPPG